MDMTKHIIALFITAAALVGCGDNIQVPACVANTDATAENICARFFGSDAQTFTCDAELSMTELANSVGMSACETNRGITCCY